MDDLQLQQHAQAQQQAVIHDQQQAQAQQMYHGPVEEQQHQQAQEQQQQQQAPDMYSFERLFPETPVAQGPPPVAAPAQTKAEKRERKRQEKEDLENAHYQYADVTRWMKEHPHLLDVERTVFSLDFFQRADTREKWAKEKLPHSQLTREETLRQIIYEKDYSNFENLDQITRNVVAARAFKEFLNKYHIEDHMNIYHAEDQEKDDLDPAEICQKIKESGEGVSALLDPGLRLALSLAQKSYEFTDKFKEFCRQLDEQMSTEVMVATLTTQTDKKKLSDYFEGKGKTIWEAAGDANRAIRENKAQQIQIAKRLLLMQMAEFKTIKTDTHRNEKVEDWDDKTPVTVALSHCSRVVLTLPTIGEDGSNADELQEMWRSILTVDGENTAQDNSRASSTHSIERRRVVSGEEPRVRKSKEKKVLFNFTGQRGMNCAIGGLGNAGVSGKTLLNNGSCGHFYSMYEEGDEEHYGAMLMGIESDAHGVMNQMGHTHDIHATPEKASSLGAQRTDEIGDKYGGRQCDLTYFRAKEITKWMKALETKMLEWQSNLNDDGTLCEEAVRAMKLIAGKPLNPQQSIHNAGVYELKELLGIPEDYSYFRLSPWRS